MIDLLSNLPTRGVLLDNTNVFSVRTAVTPYLALAPQKAPKQQTISTEENSEVVLRSSLVRQVCRESAGPYALTCMFLAQAFIRMLQRRASQAQQRVPPSAKRPQSEQSKQQGAGAGPGGGDSEAGPVAKKAKLSKAFAAVAGKAAAQAEAAVDAAQPDKGQEAVGHSAAAAVAAGSGPSKKTPAAATTKADKAAAPGTSKAQAAEPTQPATAAPGARPAAGALVAAVQGQGRGGGGATPSSSSRFTTFTQEELGRRQVKDLKVLARVTPGVVRTGLPEYVLASACGHHPGWHVNGCNFRCCMNDCRSCASRGRWL
jgi:hypothetical protein